MKSINVREIKQEKQTSLTSSAGGAGRGGGGKNCLTLDISTASSTAHCGQENLTSPWGTFKIALQLAQGNCIFVGSIPRAGTCDEAAFMWVGLVLLVVLLEVVLLGTLPPVDAGMSSGGSICGRLHVPQMNSVRPGPTVKMMWHPAQRTCTPTFGGGGGGTGGCVIINNSLIS